MDFGKIQASIQDAWNFAWPPILLLSFMLFSLFAIAPSIYSKLKEAATSLTDPRRARVLRTHLRIWGLGKLLPVVMAILVIFLLYITSRAAAAVGSLLPPHIAIRKEVLFLERADIRLLSCLADQPLAGDARALFRATRRLASLTRDDPNVKNWRDNAGIFYGRLGTIKSLLLWVLICLCLRLLGAHRVRIRSALALTALLLAFGVLVIVQFLYAVDQEAYAIAGAGEERLLDTERCSKIQFTPEEEARIAKTIEELRVGERWWWLQASPTDYKLEWLYRQVLRGGA